ncbi:hypothetical protein [Thomasclavelia ramosa]|nr:hypothetical protein [Thomasclavelia ramosa]
MYWNINYLVRNKQLNVINEQKNVEKCLIRVYPCSQGGTKNE